MSIKFIIKKGESEAVVNIEEYESTETIDSMVTELIDNYGAAKADLAKKKAKLAPLEKRVAKFEKELHEVSDTFESDTTVVLASDNYEVSFGKCGKVVVNIDTELARQILGDELWDNLAKVSVGDIRKYTNHEDQEEIFEEKLKGKRSMKLEALR